MREFMTIGNFIFLIMFIGAIFAAVKFGGKQYIFNAIYQLMVQAEIELGNGKGEEKLFRVLDLYDKSINSLPSIPKFTLKILFSKKKIINYIEKLVSQINIYFRNHYIENTESKIEVIDKFKNKALNVEFFGDKTLVSNSQIENIADDLKGGILNGDGKVYARL
ncbi:hypothetical protein [uncultured Ilyobacter sp.]|uniref:hypothetical protein n=1 Tax=uncultured Ilyobacter sp. TaxID=544433 RepID=UPI0029C097EA|nr:hypothetical protein [uncultured Ilyobacter sp.]